MPFKPKKSLGQHFLKSKRALGQIISAAKIQPGEIYNLGAQSHVQESWLQPLATADQTGLGALRIYESVRNVAPKARVSQASTSELFGEPKIAPQNKNTPFNPANPYAAAKALAHFDARIYRKSFNLFISTGISSDAEIELISQKAMDVDTTFFHCVSAYPTLPNESRLCELKRLERQDIGNGTAYSIRSIGLSDHSGLPEIPVAAVAMGATVIEVHLTMDKNQEGPDHKASMEPETFAEMIRMIRNVEKAI